MLREAGVHERMDAEGLVHEGVELLVSGKRVRVDLKALTGGKTVAGVYGQTEVTRDLMDARAADGAFNHLLGHENVQPHEMKGESLYVYERILKTHRIDCDYIAGCDSSTGLPTFHEVLTARARVSIRLAGTAVRHATGQPRVDLCPPRP